MIHSCVRQGHLVMESESFGAVWVPVLAFGYSRVCLLLAVPCLTKLELRQPGVVVYPNGQAWQGSGKVATQPSGTLLGKVKGN